MKKSKYNTLSFNKHDIFAERLKSLCKERHLTQVGLAGKIGYSLDTVRGWTKRGKHFPNMDKLIELSEFFNVDVAYLLGEQNCRKIETQRITDLTGLSEASAETLQNEVTIDILDELLSHNDFYKLMHNIWLYCHSHTAKIEIEDESSVGIEYPSTTSKENKEMIKFAATDTFSRILDSLWNKNEETMLYALDEKNIIELFSYICEYYDLAKENSKAMDNMKELIKIRLENLKSDSFKALKKFSPEEIFEHYEEIADSLKISLNKKQTLK